MRFIFTLLFFMTLYNSEAFSALECLKILSQKSTQTGMEPNSTNLLSTSSPFDSKKLALRAADTAFGVNVIADHLIGFSVEIQDLETLKEIHFYLSELKEYKLGLNPPEKLKVNEAVLLSIVDFKLSNKTVDDVKESIESDYSLDLRRSEMSEKTVGVYWWHKAHQHFVLGDLISSYAYIHKITDIPLDYKIINRTERRLVTLKVAIELQHPDIVSKNSRSFSNFFRKAKYRLNGQGNFSLLKDNWGPLWANYFINDM